MLKKTITLGVISCMIFGGYTKVQAEEGPIFKNTIISSNSTISSDTIVTKDNLDEVFKYLDIDSGNFRKVDMKEKKNTSVGDLKEAIEKAKKLPKEIKSESVERVNTLPTSTELISLASTKGTKMLYKDTDLDGYTLTYEASGNYSGKKWTGVGALNVSVDSPDLLLTRQIDSKDLKASYTSSVIELKANIDVGVYVGVGDFGIIKISSQNVKSTIKWYASSEL